MAVAAKKISEVTENAFASRLKKFVFWKKFGKIPLLI